MSNYVDVYIMEKGESEKVKVRMGILIDENERPVKEIEKYLAVTLSDLIDLKKTGESLHSELSFEGHSITFDFMQLVPPFAFWGVGRVEIINVISRTLVEWIGLFLQGI